MQPERISNNLVEGQTGDGLEAINCILVTKEGLFSSENKKMEVVARLPQKSFSMTPQRKLILRENGNSFDGLQVKRILLKDVRDFSSPINN